MRQVPVTLTRHTDSFQVRKSVSEIEISVVVPARNEEATIAQVVERSFQAFTELRRKGEVLVVNDGSTDSTAVILADLQKFHLICGSSPTGVARA